MGHGSEKTPCVSCTYEYSSSYFSTASVFRCFQDQKQIIKCLSSGITETKTSEFLRIVTARFSCVMSANGITKYFCFGERFYFAFVSKVVIQRALRLMLTFRVGH